MKKMTTKTSVAGAIAYAIWGLLHVQAAYAVYRVGVAMEPGMVQGRVFQDSWNLLFFGGAAIALALTLNLRNSAWGYWINLGLISLATIAASSQVRNSAESSVRGDRRDISGYCEWRELCWTAAWQTKMRERSYLYR
jgi:hypothetical protein